MFLENAFMMQFLKDISIILFICMIYYQINKNETKNLDTRIKES